MLLADKIKRCAAATALFELRCLRLLINAPTLEFALIALSGEGVVDVVVTVTAATDASEALEAVQTKAVSLDKVSVVTSVEHVEVVVVVEEVDDDGNGGGGRGGDGVELLSLFIYLGLQQEVEEEAVAGCSFVSNVGQL